VEGIDSKTREKNKSRKAGMTTSKDLCRAVIKQQEGGKRKRSVGRKIKGKARHKEKEEKRKAEHGQKGLRRVQYRWSGNCHLWTVWESESATGGMGPRNVRCKKTIGVKGEEH